MPLILVILAVAAAVALGQLAAGGAQAMVLLALLGIGVAVVAFLSPKISLGLLVFSMLLSPKIGFGAVGGGREAVLRYDDILLVVIFLSWLGRTAVSKARPFITSTPVQLPVLLYTSLAVLSTALGIIRGEVSAKMSVFYVLKYVEYFLLYFMTVNIVENEKDIRRYLRLGALVAVAVTIYAFYYYYGSGPDARATAPFEAVVGSSVNASEPASLGGYYLLVFGTLMAFMSEYSGRGFLVFAALLVFMFPAFLLTFSRSSYIGLTFMLPAMFFLMRKGRLAMMGFVASGLILLAMLPGISAKVMDRITMTYQGVYATETFQTGSAGSIKLEESAAARVHSLQRVIYEKLPKHPFLGWGVTGIGIGDTQYSLVLGEMGVLGALVFAWMLYSLFRTAKTVFRLSKDPAMRALALGFMVSLVGLLFQSVGVNTFIIIRIMEPFWFLAAMLSVVHNRLAGEKASA